jgi:hypothetical protein
LSFLKRGLVLLDALRGELISAVEGDVDWFDSAYLSVVMDK